MKTRNYLPLLTLTLLYSILISCTSSSNSPKEGFIDVKGGKVWYRINGTGNKPAWIQAPGLHRAPRHGGNPPRDAGGRGGSALRP